MPVKFHGHVGGLARMHRAGACMMIAVIGLAGGAAASAQSNTLFGGRKVTRPPAPTTQPASPPPRPAEGPGARAGAIPVESTPPPNAVLLSASPIAVRKPEPQKVGVNDQVTIIVRESKTALSDSSFSAKRDWTHEWALNEWIRLTSAGVLAPALFQQGRPSVAFEALNDVDNSGSYDRKDELTTRIQATVIDVKPNGALTLEATKEILVDEEGYRIRLTGDCRSQDLTPQNTVLSTQVANLGVEVTHRGGVKDAAERGWLQKFLDAVKPF